MKDFEDILNGTETTEEVTEAPAEVAEVVEAPEVAAEAEPEKVERPRGPDGKFIPKGETDASPASNEPTLEHPALLGERRRRQEAEAEREMLRQQLAQFQQQQQQPQAQVPQDAPDRWEDPEGYDRWLVNQAATAAREEAMQAFQYQRIQTAATEARNRLPDYDEKIGVFGQMVQVNPALLEQLHRAPNPAEYAYNTAKVQIEISQYGGIEGLIKARVDEALKAQAPAQTTPTQTIPETLAGEQSARTGATLYAPPSLSDILAR